MVQGLCLYDAEDRLQVFNRRFREIFGIAPEKIQPGMAFSDVLALSVAAGNHGGQTVTDLLAEQRALTDEAGGGYFQTLSSGQIVSIAHRPTSNGGWLATYEDVTEQHRAAAKIAFMARHDHLTKLPNRSVLSERIEQALALAARGSGFSVLCLDLDDFKQVNDNWGHPTAMNCFARWLTGCAAACGNRRRRSAGRRRIRHHPGGNRQPRGGRPARQARGRTCQRRLRARRPARCHRLQHRHFDGPSDGESPEKLLKNADIALYRAKTEGRSTWRFFETEMDAILQDVVARIDLRDAMANDEFELFYQLVYDLGSDQPSGFEALLRWRHPTRGMVSPAQFIPVAEEMGLIIPLGEWVLRRACEQAADWPKQLKLAVNVSAVQFRSDTLVAAVENALAASNFPAHRLELEITESVLLTNSAATLATLHRLRALGVRIALDDFGTGYSSLSYLRSFPFKKLKIDQSFVRDLTATDDSSMLIVRAIIGLGKSLGMRTTAEGIETIEQIGVDPGGRLRRGAGVLPEPPGAGDRIARRPDEMATRPEEIQPAQVGARLKSQLFQLSRR